MQLAHTRVARLRFALISLVPLLLSALLSACGDQAPAQPTAVSGNPTPSGPTTVNINMESFKFVPEEVTVVAGSTVVWTNGEAPKHTVTEDGESFDSGTMNKGDTFSRTFDTAGTVGYFCKFHGSAGSGMFGRIVVVPASGQTGNASPTTAQEPTEVAAQATPTEAEAEPTPTAAAAEPTATAAPPAAVGSVRFRDVLARNDRALIKVDSLPKRPAGKALYAWLTGPGAPVSLGRITGTALDQQYDAPAENNLLADYDGFKVTLEELEVTPASPSTDVVLSGQLPPNALVHIRHLLVAFEATPNQVGLEVGLLDQVSLVKEHAEYMREAQTQGNLAAVKLHAEHLVNIIEGSKGANFGDSDKNGKVTNPGDGFGLLSGGDQLGYLQGSKDHAELAATAADATADIKLHAGHVAVTVENVTGWVTSIRDKSLDVLKAADAAAADQGVKDIFALANQALNGVDLQGDGQILPIPGSGGAITSYQHAQLMAAIPVTTAGGAAGQGQTGAPTVAPAPPTEAPVEPTATTAAAQPTAPSGGGSETTVDISQFRFGASALTVKAGTKVTWTNNDTAPHTVTADGQLFDSGTLQNGQSFSFTFAQAGEFPYYCALHGGPGGQGMASTVVVEP